MKEKVKKLFLTMLKWLGVGVCVPWIVFFSAIGICGSGMCVDLLLVQYDLWKFFVYLVLSGLSCGIAVAALNFAIWLGSKE